MIDRTSQALEEIRAAVVLFAHFAAVGDFAKAEQHASNAFAAAALLPEEDLADA